MEFALARPKKEGVTSKAPVAKVKLTIQSFPPE